MFISSSFLIYCFLYFSKSVGKLFKVFLYIIQD